MDQKPKIISIAPMMEWTDRHFRYFARILSKHVYLYTEMVVTHAILKGDRERFLQYHQDEHPVALQLGGSNPEDLAECSKIAQDYGYDEVNLNVGCPSDRVQSGMIGACLMKHPDLVARCFETMQKAVDIPVTIKSRIGVDDIDTYEHFQNFVQTIYNAGCRDLTVHARKAWLKGLSPKENRTKPPLHYEFVYNIKEEFPDMYIGINGGVTSIQEAQKHLQKIDHVMIGREAYNNPFILTEVDHTFYGEEANTVNRKELIRAFYPYIESELEKGQRLKYMAFHLMGMFAGVGGARKFRHHLTTQAGRENAGIDVMEEALAFIVEEVTTRTAV